MAGSRGFCKATGFFCPLANGIVAANKVYLNKNNQLLQASTIQLLRIPFSYFLMPVYWFALSFAPAVQWPAAAWVFVVLHLLVYPASNGYNSYMDRDTGSIGGIEKPMTPTTQLFAITIILDLLAIVASLMVSVVLAAGIALYIACSRLYSYRGVRLKQYPFIGYLVVVLNQGALTFFLVYYSATGGVGYPPWQGLVAATFLIGGFYPITQVYQHQADRADGVITISMRLGRRGTFLFCGVMYTIALLVLLFYFVQRQQLQRFLVLQLFFLPVLVYFINWWMAVRRNEQLADFKHTMRMNWLASTCTSLAFITLIILQTIG